MWRAFGQLQNSKSGRKPTRIRLIHPWQNSRIPVLEADGQSLSEIGSGEILRNQVGSRARSRVSAALNCTWRLIRRVQGGGCVSSKEVFTLAIRRNCLRQDAGKSASAFSRRYFGNLGGSLPALKFL